MEFDPRLLEIISLSVSGQLFLSFDSNEHELFGSLAKADSKSKRNACEWQENAQSIMLFSFLFPE